MPCIYLYGILHRSAPCCNLSPIADIPGLAVDIIGFQDKPGISNAKPGNQSKTWICVDKRGFSLDITEFKLQNQV